MVESVGHQVGSSSSRHRTVQRSTKYFLLLFCRILIAFYEVIIFESIYLFLVLIGMVNRIGCGEETSEVLDRRLKSLSNFQAMLLRHALGFPSVRRVVYSTCSVYERENELVIHDVLQSASSDFRLVDILPMFSSRGKSSALPEAKSCVRLSPETSLTIGFFIACLERVDKVPECHPSSSKSEFCGQKEKCETVSESVTHEVQVESSAVSERRESHKRKKLKKEKSAELEHCEEDATVVKDRSSSELDGQSQKMAPTFGTVETEIMGESRKSHKRKKLKKEKTVELEHCEEDATAVKDDSSSKLKKTAPTTGTVETITVGESRKLHKRKKSKKDKSVKLAKLEHSKFDSAVVLERLDHVCNSPVLALTSDAMQSQQETASDNKKSHKHKKSWKEKANRVEQSEIRSTAVNERPEFELDGLSHTSLSENTPFVSGSTSDVVQAEHDTVGESRKLHKHKKSRKEKNCEVYQAGTLCD